MRDECGRGAVKKGVEDFAGAVLKKVAGMPPRFILHFIKGNL